MKKTKQKQFYGTGNLYLTPLKRVVLDNHSNEAFFPDGDIILATYEELTQGIRIDKVLKRIMREEKVDLKKAGLEPKQDKTP